MAKATDLVKSVTREIKAGELFEGRVTRVFDFGVMVEIAPRTEGMVHISELAPWRVEHVSDIVKAGDIIPVIVKEIDDQGRVNLSLKRVPNRYSEEDIAKHTSENPFSSREGGKASHPRRHDGGHGGYRPRR